MWCPMAIGLVHAGILFYYYYCILKECYCVLFALNCNADNHSLVYSTFYVFFSFQIRDNLKQLLRNLNSQKNCIKKHGIVVDGKKYRIKFTGITNSFD